MTRAVLTFVLLASCANPSKTGPATGASVASAPVPVATPEPREVAPPPAATETAPPSASSAPAASSAAPEATPPQAVAARGEVSSRFEGCLTEADPMATKTRSMAPEKPDRVEVQSDARSVRVAHHLNHACCLKAETSVEQSGKTVTLVERLSGTPCRCRCASVIHSQLQLPAGEYDLHVRLEQAAGKAEVHHQAVSVSADAMPKPKLPLKLPLKRD